MVRPVKGLVETLFDAGKRCAFFYSWENLRDLSPVGCLELSKFIAYRGNPHEADDLTVEKGCPILELLILPSCTLLPLMKSVMTTAG